MTHWAILVGPKLQHSDVYRALESGRTGSEPCATRGLPHRAARRWWLERARQPADPVRDVPPKATRRGGRLSAGRQTTAGVRGRSREDADAPPAETRSWTRQDGRRRALLRGLRERATDEQERSNGIQPPKSKERGNDESGQHGPMATGSACDRRAAELLASEPASRPSGPEGARIPMRTDGARGRGQAAAASRALHGVSLIGRKGLGRRGRAALAVSMRTCRGGNRGHRFESV